jgi:hypothetical protein
VLILSGDHIAGRIFQVYTRAGVNIVVWAKAPTLIVLLELSQDQQATACRPNPAAYCINKVLLAHSHAHLVTLCMGLLSHCNRVETLVPSNTKKLYHLGLFRRSFLTSGLYHWFWGCSFMATVVIVCIPLLRNKIPEAERF